MSKSFLGYIPRWRTARSEVTSILNLFKSATLFLNLILTRVGKKPNLQTFGTQNAYIIVPIGPVVHIDLQKHNDFQYIHCSVFLLEFSFNNSGLAFGLTITLIKHICMQHRVLSALRKTTEQNAATTQLRSRDSWA